jgi:glycosyltransferase involved in cell wall biosynthesis
MVGGRIEKYLFITTGSFPIGNAATNRALSYTRGLAELGCDVTLLILGPDYKQSQRSNKKQINYNGVNIQYSCPFLFVKDGLFGKLNFLLGIFFGYIYLLKNLFKYNKKLAVSLIFIEPIFLHFFILTIKIFNGKVFHERTEFPILSKKSNFMYKYYLNIVIPLFDGLYVISYSLIDFFRKITIKPILLLPMTVEIDRFKIEKTLDDKNYLAYCGSMYTDKDGVPDLIEAFNEVASEFSDIFLFLIGDNSNKEKFALIDSKIFESKYKNRIICTGQVDRDSMPELLNNAKILVLCRPDNLQAQGGFPTKLGEYLATSKPVVITDVGDHTKYLQDGISAFIAKPNDPKDFAKKIIQCLSQPELAKEIGKEGYHVAMNHFNYKKQAIRLKEFIETIE